MDKRIEDPQTLEATQTVKPSPSSTSLSGPATVLLGSYLIILGIVLAYLVIKFFPPYPWIGWAALPVTFFGRYPVWLTFEERLLVEVMVTGAMGSYLRAIIAFAKHAEDGRMPHFVWIWWCILQTFIGIILAALFYFVLRGTVYINIHSEDLNPYVIFGTAGVVGMFSGQAADKLGAYFGTVKLGS